MIGILRHMRAYGLIAALCALLHIAVLIAGETAGLHYALSTVISFIVCVLVGYDLHVRYTFAMERSGPGLWRYAFAMTVNLPASLTATWLLRDLLALPMTVAAPAGTLALTAANYLFARAAILGRVRA